MTSRESVVYVLPGKMGGVVTNLSNLQRHCDPAKYCQYTILTYNPLDRDTVYEGPMPSEGEARFTHSMPLENLHSVLRRLGKLVPSGEGVLVASDWLELAWASKRPSGRAVFQILHGDFDFYYDLAVKHEDVVDVFIACSRLIHEKLSRLLPRSADRIHHVPYGVPVPGEARASHSGRLKAIYAGRLEQRQKRIFDLPLIDAALRERGADVEWTVVGGGPDEEALCSRWGAGRVEWRGVLGNRETVDLMKLHDVFVLPSEAEGLPLALLEAMSVGLVPVVSDVASGVRDVVIAETGIRVPVGDVPAFANSIALLDRDRSRLDSLGRGSRRLVQEQFDVRLQAARYQALYARWRELRRPSVRGSRLRFGSRLDRPWIPNGVVRFMRSRTRPELAALLAEKRKKSRGASRATTNGIEKTPFEAARPTSNQE